MSWTAPSANPLVDFGATITGYQVFILASDGVTFIQENVSCLSNSGTIVSLATCSVPLTTLTAAPYNLVAGNSISVKITALNVIGSSPFSIVGNGAILAFSTVPDKPKLLTRDELLTTTSRIGLNWSDGDSNGG
jgi:hypothetical protein